MAHGNPLQDIFQNIGSGLNDFFQNANFLDYAQIAGGFLSGNPILGLGGFGNPFDRAAIEGANDRAFGRLTDARGELTDFANRFSFDNNRSALNIGGLESDLNSIVAGLREERPDLEQTFRDERNFGLVDIGGIDFDPFKSNQLDFSKLGGDISDIFDTARGEVGSKITEGQGFLKEGFEQSKGFINKLGEARITPGSLFGQVDLPTDLDFDDRLNANLQGIATAGSRQEQLANQRGAASALQSGGLEGAQAEQGRLAFLSGQSRALQSGQARAQGEQAKDQFQRFRGGLQGQLATTEAQLNTGLATTGANLGVEAALRTAVASGELTAQEASIIAGLRTSEAGETSRIGLAGLDDKRLRDAQILQGLLTERGQDIDVGFGNEDLKRLFSLDIRDSADADFANLGRLSQLDINNRNTIQNELLEALGLSQLSDQFSTGLGAQLLSGYQENLLLPSSGLQDLLDRLLGLKSTESDGGSGITGGLELGPFSFSKDF